MSKRLMSRTGRPRGPRSPTEARRARSVRASVAVVLTMMQLAGCYRYVPVSQAATPVGADVWLGINDRGRVALTDAVGPGVRRMEGRVLENTDSSLVMAVSSVQHIDLGVPAKWMGERVEVGRDLVNELRERRFSATRTGIALGLVAAGAIAVSFIAIEGFGSDGGGGGGGNGNQQMRVR
jgi:hypothetical protein